MQYRIYIQSKYGTVLQRLKLLSCYRATLVLGVQLPIHPLALDPVYSSVLPIQYYHYIQTADQLCKVPSSFSDFCPYYGSQPETLRALIE